ncbi:hypothetical protein TRM7557_01717 [Tritonibacter multivorans]|uniref:Uncharacterized protein n=1 Tax=Tritonibacter multivorans TaxID=928856 RepID=A0A0P1G914_9RHOB|nr:hypothetical protein TRM7557_01717 [Tritonibacter multivorans]SFD02951.1 hypothetical protein SAMN04488049_1068 [Tritonibacter multivorans]
MTLAGIKAAVEAGNRVHWVNSGYVVTRDDLGQYLITFTRNGSAIGLTSRDSTRLNGEPDEVFIEEKAEDCHEVF